MNAAFRQNLSVVFTFDGNNSGIARDTRGSLGDVTDRARFCRTTETPNPGVDSPRIEARTGSGGWQRGSLTPQMPTSLLLTAAPTATRAAKSAARLTAVKSLIAKNIATSPNDAITFLWRLVDQRTAHEQGGPLLPSLWSPLLFFAFADSAGVQRSENSHLNSMFDPLATVLAQRIHLPD